jgi:hypothetical protein
MLTKEHIDHLFAFCNKHYVQHYDLQIELVDHLANAVEEKMAIDSQLSFEEALNKVYTGFGIRGFADIVKARTHAANSLCRKLRRKIFFSYFTLPKAAMTVCLMMALYMLPQFLTGNKLVYVLGSAGAALWIYETIVFAQIVKRWNAQKRPLLLTGAGFNEAFLLLFFVLPATLPFFDEYYFTNNGQFSSVTYLVDAISMVLVFITTLAYKEFGCKLDQLARAEYPEAYLAK